MRLAITGADGFLGWHLRIRLAALRPDDSVAAIGLDDWPRLAELVAGADVVLHLAGINRAADAELEDGNVSLAREVAAAAAASGSVKRVVYANSVQAGNGTPYGNGKLAAAELLTSTLAEHGISVVDVRLPNLFGEHGRPNYNSFVATFVDKVIAGESPEIQDRPISLLHAQGAAQALLDAAAGDPGVVFPAGHQTSVVEVWNLLQGFHRLYVPSGDLPDLAEPFTRDLFNTYRAALFPAHYPVRLQPRSDDRGRLVETVRCHGSGGQTFVSTTHPGITRGEHYHLHKVERFVVLDGSAEIALRKMFTDEVVAFSVTGDEPVAVDMPVGWTHNITATGDRTITTQFWTDSLFDPEAPDTYWTKVRPDTEAAAEGLK